MEFKEGYRQQRLLTEALLLRRAHDKAVQQLKDLLYLRRNTMSIPSHIMQRAYSSRDIRETILVIRAMRRELDLFRMQHDLSGIRVAKAF